MIVIADMNTTSTPVAFHNLPISRLVMIATAIAKRSMALDILLMNSAIEEKILLAPLLCKNFLFFLSNNVTLVFNGVIALVRTTRVIANELIINIKEPITADALIIPFIGRLAIIAKETANDNNSVPILSIISAIALNLNEAKNSSTPSLITVIA